MARKRFQEEHENHERWLVSYADFITLLTERGALEGVALFYKLATALFAPNPDLVDMLGEFHGVDGKLDIHVALDLASAGGVDEFLGRLGDDRVAVVVEPVDQRTDRGILLILDQRSVVKGADQSTLALELAQQALVVDVESKRFGGGVEVCAVNEQSNAFDISHFFLTSV